MRRREPGVQALRDDYLRSVEQAGAVPVAAAGRCRPEDAPLVLDRVDGLLLSGGDDVDPALYGQSPASEAPDASTAGATTSSSRSSARRSGAIARCSLSVGDSRC